MLKKVGSLLVVLPLLMTMLSMDSISSVSTFNNLFIYADVPIMKSFDLVNWEIVNHVYDTYANDDSHNRIIRLFIRREILFIYP